MAEDTIKKVIHIETEGGEKTVKSLKNEISQLRDKLLNLERGSVDYKKAMDQLITDTADLNTVMLKNKSQVTALDGSYNALSQQMSILKQEWKATNDEARRTELGEQIKSINDQLKEFDGSIGNFQRNVGNYADSFKSAFKDMGDGMDVVAKGSKGLTKNIGDLGKGIKALLANPVVAILGLIIGAFMSLKNAIQNNSAAMENINKAMEKFEPIGNIVSNVIGKISESVAKLVEWLADKLVPVFKWFVEKGLNGLANGFIKTLNFMMTPFQYFISFVINSIQNVIAIADAVGKKLGLWDLTNVVEGLNNVSSAIRNFKIDTVNLSISFDELSRATKYNTDVIKENAEAYAKWASTHVNEIIEGQKKIAEWEKKLADEAYFQSGKWKDNYKENPSEESVDEPDILKGLLAQNDLRLNAEKQYSTEWEKLMLERQDMEWTFLQAKMQAEMATDAQIEAAHKASEKKKADISKKAASERKKVLQTELSSTLGSLSSALGGIADMMDENSEDQFNTMKQLQTSAAIISGIQAGINVWATPSTIPDPYGIIFKTAQSIAVAGSVIAQIRQIQNTKFGETNIPSTSTTPAAVAAPQVPNWEPTYTRNVLTDTETEELNRPMYVSVVDINDVQNKVKVVETSSTF